MSLAVNPGAQMPWQWRGTTRSFARQMEEYCKQRTADLIKTERLRHGENPRDVAYALGIDTRTYERWEAGDTMPQPSNFKALSEHWGIPITELRPDLEAEQAQLDRIEEKLDEILKRLDRQDGAEGGSVPRPGPTPPTKPPNPREQPKKRAGRKRSV